ncbi:uncharacterized protein LOC111715454 isoform X2 [Eurytemora carolleeae]|uniref:uncharacterized protein LOC111715454 isoform X2 n=1 Tax=Eurytemora carolleeae TaxID=1294199 RepID=UPI000C75B835|nr:uncharacterized protein LOC111715454 isoform X2 [Eurytemora carolleeae]|eukprot:XP_023346546.1 uncharacterized protein LOC111715454 isoform X2 [Eurytemora affinis]
MSTLSTLPPRYRQSGGGAGGVVGGRAAGGGAGDVVGGRAAGGGSRLLQIQAKLQARQLQEKEEKLFNLLEDRKEPVLPRLGRENVYSGNSLTSSSSSVSMFAGRPVLGGGQVRQIFQERSKTSNTRNSRSPVGWDKSYPLRPVEVEPRTPHVPVYKQNITRTNSYNKYSGNYGVNKVGDIPNILVMM